MDSFDVLDEEAKENSGDVPKLGVKLESIEPVSDKAIMVHHENHHRPCPSCETQVGDGDGPRCSNSTITSGAYDVVVAAAVSGAAVPGSGAVVRAVQPSDISTYSTPHTVSKFPVGSSGLNLRLSNSSDPEPGRCKRTDGKKWRCSRDVAPNHKYCERHLHRGRPRSRKPVEIQANNSSSSSKRTRREDYSALPTFVNIPIPRPTVNNNSVSSQFLGPTAGSPFHRPTDVSLTSHNDPRSLDWVVKGEPVPMATTDQQWHHLMQNKMEFASETFSHCHPNASIFKQNYPEEPLNLNSYVYFSTCEDTQSKDCPLFLNSDMISTQEPHTGTTRGFIDAWSNAVTEENIANSSTLCSVSSNGFSPSLLTLSMGGSNSIDDEMGQLQMGSGLIGRNRNNESGSKSDISRWYTPASSVAAPTPGGPLAEVLRPSMVAIAAAAASNVSSPTPGNGDSRGDSTRSHATMVSSPSGVLQKTFASLSDSSGNSSPNLGSSRATPEIAMLWLN
ncbi:hypothetical protein F2P56_035297 [Juglans regia]|uniref:Growth-regulating factor n=1 Tax=Juglans regia TaxID=51240 RepID=A0A833WTC3_JUGRE|nr:hypothetical protein F2P56_035297 [Juglans regia]